MLKRSVEQDAPPYGKEVDMYVKVETQIERAINILLLQVGLWGDHVHIVS